MGKRINRVKAKSFMEAFGGTSDEEKLEEERKKKKKKTPKRIGALKDMLIQRFSGQ